MNNKSFSLIELLIVVTIIAVLTGAALPFVGEYLEQSKVSKAKNDLDEISRAINAFEVTTGTAYSDTTGNVLKGRFLQKLPIDPWGTPYGFASAVEANGATVYSSGPDHIAGTVDDITVSYKGPLAIVSAKWQDNNNDGLISGKSDAYPTSDTFIIRFNRMASSSDDGTDPKTQFLSGVGGDNLRISSGTWDNYFDWDSSETVSLSADGRTLIFQVLPVAVASPSKMFTLGSDTISMTTGLVDAAGNPGISASVTILAQ